MELRNVVKDHVINIYKECGYNKLEAARILNISVKTVYKYTKDIMQDEQVDTAEIQEPNSRYDKKIFPTNKERLKYIDDGIRLRE